MEQDQEPTPAETPQRRPQSVIHQPVTTVEQLESQLLEALLEFYAWWQLTALPGKVNGIPKSSRCLPFWSIDHKEVVAIQKRPVGRSPQKIRGAGQCFFMDFGLLLASDYSRLLTSMDRGMTSCDGFSAYFLVMEEATRHV